MALAGMAIADSVMVVWDTKAAYFTWRPAIAIHEADLDGNPDTGKDAGWTPRNTSIGASPEYNSGTSSFGGATSAVLEGFYGDTNISVCFQTDLAAERAALLLERAAGGGGGGPLAHLSGHPLPVLE